MAGRAERSWAATVRDAFVGNARSVPLRRAQSSFAFAWTAEQAFAVAVSVVAFTHGGAGAVGLLAAVRSVPAALVPPIVMPFVARFGPVPLLVAACVTRAAATAGIAVVVATDAPFAWVYLLAVAATAAHTVYRPAHSALLPPLSHTPTELVNANAVRGLSDSTASLVGPALAGALLGASGAPAAFWMVVGLSAAASVAAARVGPVEAAAAGLVTPVRRRLPRHGRAPLRDAPALRLLLALAAVQTFTRGAYAVLVVVVSMDRLHAGGSGVGTLSAAVGAGALAGSVAVATLTSRHLGRWFGVGVALWGLPLAALAFTPSLPWAVLALAPVGLGNALVDVGLFTLLGRLTTPRTAPRVFGLLESVVAAGVAAGSLAAPALVHTFGVRGASVGVGFVAPLLVVAAWAGLARLDAAVGARDERIALLRRVDMLRPLSLPAVEQLAAALAPVRFGTGDEVFRQGDPGDRFFVIDEGVAEVVGDGRDIRRLEPGEGFGEIALLRRVPRTATVRAATPLRLYALDRESFLAAVTGSAASREQAARDVDDRLRRFTPRQRATGERPLADNPHLG